MRWCIHDTHVSERLSLVHKEGALHFIFKKMCLFHHCKTQLNLYKPGLKFKWSRSKSNGGHSDPDNALSFEPVSALILSLIL